MPANLREQAAHSSQGQQTSHYGVKRPEVFGRAYPIYQLGRIRCEQNCGCEVARNRGEEKECVFRGVIEPTGVAGSPLRARDVDRKPEGAPFMRLRSR
jgi:hypothetical protein